MSKIITICLLVFMTMLNTGCTEEDTTDQFPFILFQHGDGLMSEGDEIPVGGQMRFGISAVGGGSAITNLRVKRYAGDQVVTELDRGMYIATGGLDTVLIFPKSNEEKEVWNFFIMNQNRDTASISMTVFKGDGSAYGDIFYYPSINLSYPSNTMYGNFLDLDSGMVYSQTDVAGHEPEIDLVSFFYYTSGSPSPTLTCPGYTSAQTYYPVFSTWPVKNTTTYDYKTTDNDLVSQEQFNAAINDSLLVCGYKPQYVSGLCKFCYTGKVIPIKTTNGKYGMISVIRADEQEDGSMEIAVKIQK